MDFKFIDYNTIPFLSNKDLAYINEKAELRSFYEYDINLDSFEQVIAKRIQKSVDRSILVEVLHDQYKSKAPSAVVRQNIDSLLDEKTFTVITAHQPALFTGPLYFIYKICSTIHLSTLLNQRFPEYHIVPLFILGGEDHDFDEINHLNLFGKTIRWEHPEPGGPVGRMDLRGIPACLDQLSAVLGDSERALEISKVLRSSFSEDSSYGEGMRKWVHHLFAKYGLVIVSTDDRRLKHAFTSTIKDEIFNKTSHRLVRRTQDELDKIGFSDQAYAREINVFYMEDGIRERIVENGAGYLAGEKSFTKEEAMEMLEKQPEHFSPNVILRPLFQESVFPNLAYIGGGGEIAYWLERKNQFHHYDIPYPMVIRRNSVVCLSKGIQKGIDKTGLGLEDFLVKDINQFVSQMISTEKSISLDTYRVELQRMIDRLAEDAAHQDPTLQSYVAAEGTKMEKSLDNIEKRMLKAAKSQAEIRINRIRNIYDKLFPNQSLQERKENFLSIYVKLGDEFLDFLVEHLNPLDKRFLVITE